MQCYPDLVAAVNVADYEVISRKVEGVLTGGIVQEMEWKKSTERALLNTEHILRSLSRKDRWKEPIAPIGRDATASVDERGTRAASPPVAEPSQALRQEVFTRCLPGPTARNPLLPEGCM